jgi:hypothetical protein
MEEEQTMKFGVCLPNNWGVEDVQAIFLLAVRAEELGFDSVWVSEHHGSSDGYLPSLLPVLGGLATATALKEGTDLGLTYLSLRIQSRFMFEVRRDLVGKLRADVAIFDPPYGVGLTEKRTKKGARRATASIL